MKDQWMSVSDIVELMESFTRLGMGSLKLKNGEQSIAMKARCAAAPAAGAQAAPPQVPATQPVAAEAVQAPEVQRGTVVTSPIVGTFYSAPAPDKDPFVQVGQQVKKGDVLFIIESMKLMNEVLSELDGTVAELLVENAQAVEYGQPILRIE